MRKRNKRKLHKQRILVIDAHNVCYQDAQLRSLMHKDPESARRAFEAMLGDRPQCHIFYDGGPGGEERRQHHGKLAIHYSGQRSADDCIAEWLSYHNDALITVVSDDRHLQQRARSFGAQIISVNHFLNELDEQEHQEPGIDEVPPSQDEIDFWTDQFS